MKLGIPSDLMPAVLERAGQGYSTREITTWLLVNHGLKVSHVTTAKALAKLRNERSDIAKSVVREKLSSTLASDIDELKSLQLDLKNRASRCHEDTREYLAVVDRMLKVIEMKLRYSGAGEPDPGATDAVRVYLPPENFA